MPIRPACILFYIFIMKNNCKHKKGLGNAHLARMYFILYFYCEKKIVNTKKA
jgi:hypothetical protein